MADIFAYRTVFDSFCTYDGFTHIVSSIGIGTPGAVDSAKGIVVFANNLGFKNVELGKMLEEKLGKKVYCENDANVAAYGEYLVDDENEGDTLVAITMVCNIKL